MSILAGGEPAAATSESIVVGVRLRPFVGYEKDSKQKQCLTIQNNVVSVVEDALAEGSSSAKVSTKDYGFDAAMDSTDPSNPNHVDQAKCYEIMCQRMVGHILQGFHTCLFCYGQTGTGKTTTIMGDPKEEKEMGLLLRLLNDVFKEAARMREEGSNTLIQVQMFEVYNDKLNDLLHPAKDKKVHPEVRMNPIEGVYVKGAPPEAVENFETCVKLIEYGNTMKTVAATAMNKQSSRGHTIFKLILEKKGGSEGLNITSEAFFVDLAGRENEKTTKVTGDRFVELTFINLSLKFLADCIRNLGQIAKDREKPRKSVVAKKQGVGTALFRNSKLTMLLANALSGNSKTAMIGTLSPAALNFDESYSTLHFASTVKSIKVDAKPAAEVDKAVLIKTLQEEVESLKEKLVHSGGDDDDDENDLQQRMEDAQELFEEYRKEWDEKHQEAKAMMQKREEMTTQLGVYRWRLAVKKVKRQSTAGRRRGEIALPHLTNYSNDPFLTGMLVLCPEQPGRVYTGGTEQGCDFVLPHALGMNPRTFHLKSSEKGQIWIWAADYVASGARRHTIAGLNAEPSMGTSMIEVNGNKVGSVPVELNHQDCVVLGRSLIFYVISKSLEGGLSSLREIHYNHELEATEKSKEDFIAQILGDERGPARDQMDVARKYILTLQNFNRDAEGKETLSDFLLRAKQAKAMVDEANEITSFVWPHKELAFELVSTAPALAFGFGKSRCPDLAVRLVQRIPAELAKQRMKIGKVRRKSTMGAVAMLKQFADAGESSNIMELEEAKVDVLFVWTFAKFTARLQLMQEVREEKEDNPKSFKVDPQCNPWSEYGPGEIAMLRRESTLDIEVLKDELRRLREEKEELEAEVQQLHHAAGSSAAAPATSASLAVAPVAAAAAAAAATPPPACGAAGTPLHLPLEEDGRAAPQGQSAVRDRAVTPPVAPSLASPERRRPAFFDGHWAHDLDGERREEAIEGDVIRWQDGTEMTISVEDPENFFVELHGSVFRARLAQDQLEWDDGDIWTRVVVKDRKQEQLVQLLYVNNSNVEELCRTQQQLIRTVKDGMNVLDDKLTKATGELSPMSASPTARSPMTPAPSMASHIHSSHGGPYCGYLGATSASGTYLMNPPGGMQQPLAPAPPPAGPSAVAYKACTSAGGAAPMPAPVPARFLAAQVALQQHTPPAAALSPPAAALSPPATPTTPVPALAPGPMPVAAGAMVVPASPARRAPSPNYLAAAPHVLWGGSTPSSASRGVSVPRSPAAYNRGPSPDRGPTPVGVPQGVPVVVPPWHFKQEAQRPMAEPQRERSAHQAPLAKAGAASPAPQMQPQYLRHSPRGPRSP